MFPSRPAARAHRLKRQPVLDVGVRDGIAASSPGAGHTNSGLYHDYKGSDDGGLILLTTGIPVQTTTFTTNLPASGTEDTLTPTTVVQVSTSAVTIVIPEGSSWSSYPGSVSISTLPAAATNAADIIPSSSSPSLSPLSPLPSSLPSASTTVPAPSPATQDTTSSAFGGPVFGNETIYSMPAYTSPADPVLAGSVNKKSSGVSGGAIAAIVTISILATCALAFFIFRNRRIQKRIARRVTWTAGLASANFDSLEKGPSHYAISNEPTVPAGQSATSQGSTQGGTPSPVLKIARKPPLPYSPVSPTQPPQSYNNPPHVAVPYVHPTTPTSASVSAPTVPMLVRVTFVPQLPDELAITPGETLYIEMEYDDGWALCVNTRGKQGMVPLECLEGGGGQLTGPSHVGDWRMSRRASSLRSVATWT
jgi:Variant SH3 domain